MAKFKQEDAKPKWYPTHNDVKDLGEKLKDYKQIRVNGKLQSRFDLYCKSIGVIGFDEYGGVIVYQPEDYKRLSDIYWKYDKQENNARMEYLESHPEAREEIMHRLKEMRKSFGFKTLWPKNSPRRQNYRTPQIALKAPVRTLWRAQADYMK